MRSKVTGGELGGLTNLAVLAPVKTGFIKGLETMTYVERLQRLLDALNEARQNLREATLFDPPFPDAIGRFGIIRSFRYVVIPPDGTLTAKGEPGLYRLSLNVTFDGGWEPYMRVIYRDIGFLLDALFCHCDGYPGSRTSSFDTYCRWVRANEQMAGLFYSDSPVTSSDQCYLEAIECIQREADPAEVDRKIAGFALKPDTQQIQAARLKALEDPLPAIVTSLRALKGLYRLSPLFASPEEKQILLRFAQMALQDFKAILPGLQKQAIWNGIAIAARDELAWFQGDLHESATAPEPPEFDPNEVQAGIVGSPGDATHGCLVMMRVQHAEMARDWLQNAPVSRHGTQDADGIRRNIAMSYAGFQALGFSSKRLDPLPQEFMDGMEARAGILGDVRGNHPDFWPRPERCDESLQPDPNVRVDLSTVHVVLIMRLTDPRCASAALHPELKRAVSRLTPEATGMLVVAIQPTRSYREGSHAREHFGSLDGFSQPGIAVVNPRPIQRDEVPVGDLFLGYPNSLGDQPDLSHMDPLLKNGTFLVVRKLRQYVDRLQNALDSHVKAEGLAQNAAEARKKAILEKMVGRRQDGSPLVKNEGDPSSNDFDFSQDQNGSQCPFHAHVRRANPRDGRPHMPRILRSGMSYGDRFVAGSANEQADRGIVFMAYCASIAEQFEIIQRWIAGGNSTGVSSAQADPLLAVPRPGDPRTFRCLDEQGAVMRVDLKDQPFVTLEWGMYLFVPSPSALKNLDQLLSIRRGMVPVLPPSAPSAPLAPLPDSVEGWRQRLEDPDPERSVSPATWDQVRAQPGGTMDAPPYGRLVGLQEDVLRILQDKGEAYSVQGYGHRMAASIGHNYLGMDAKTGHAAQAPVVNAAIEAITEGDAFHETRKIVAELLIEIMRLAQGNPDGSRRAPVDLVALAEHVLAGLCTLWIGLPEIQANDETSAPLMVVGGRVSGDPQPPRCPGNLLAASHYTFTPHPRDEMAEAGRVQGRAALTAVRRLLESNRLGPLAQTIKTGLEGVKAIPPEHLSDVVANSISGALLGFPPTVYGNFMRTMDTWIREKTLWQVQGQLADLAAKGLDPYERARQALRGELMKTMRKRPVPEMLWRCPVESGRVVGAEDGTEDDQRVVLGIASALTDAKTPDEMMFGGSRKPESSVATEHACPGYGMGVGVMLGMIAGLLEAGTLRPTGSTVLLMLTQQRGALAPAGG